MKVETKEQLWEYFSAAIMLTIGCVVIVTGLWVASLIGGMTSELVNMSWRL